MSVRAGGVEVKAADRKQLEAWLRTHSIPQALATRARIVLGSAAGESIRALAARLGVTERTVCLWRRRYREAGLAGLRTLPRAGLPRQITAATEKAVLSATLRKPKTATHWSTRRLAKEVELSRASVHRIWRKYGLQPHRVESFKFSTDPEFDRKLADIVGLYLDPPERALVLCVDEKSQIQALDRSAPILPLLPGTPERRSHDYKRNGTSSLFAALDAASGKVIGSLHSRHRAIEFKKFLQAIDREVPAELEVHLILDNYSTHKTPAIRRWLTAHPRFHLHFTPTGASWLNLVERWFAELTARKLRRGVHRSVRRLEQAINRWLS